MNYENIINELFNRVIRYLMAQPLNLGGYTTANGGAGGPPGGFTGLLPQGRTAFDETEAEDWTIPSGYPPSGASLVTNLNRIRRRLALLEASGVGWSGNGITIEEDDVQIADGVTVLNLIGGLTATHTDINEVTISGGGAISDIGIYMSENTENLTNQVPTYTFTTANAFNSDSLKVFYNGIRQAPDKYTEGGDNQSFTVLFPTYSGDSLVVDYDVTVSGGVLEVGARQRHQLAFTVADQVTTNTGLLKITNEFERTATFVKASARCNVAVSGDLTVDLNINGSTIFATQDNRPKILSGDEYGYTTTFDTTTWSGGDYITMDVDEVTTASDLVVILSFLV